METSGFHLFKTAFGVAGLAWNERGVRTVAFPAAAAEETLVRLRRHMPDGEETPPPDDIEALARDVVALFDGGAPDFADAVLDDAALPEFDRHVLAQTRAIPVGEIRTYGEIARALGDVAYSQRVGQALGRNPFPIVVPCHRVVGADGAMTGFSAPGGVEAKRRLLKLEGALAPELFD